jgi:hypothetical protein
MTNTPETIPCEHVIAGERSYASVLATGVAHDGTEETVTFSLCSLCHARALCEMSQKIAAQGDTLATAAVQRDAAGNVTHLNWRAAEVDA